MDARILDANGDEIGPLEQRDLFPPVRLNLKIHDDLIQALVDRDYARDLVIALRAVLAPLLDDPYEMHDFEASYDLGGDPIWWCRFCHVEPEWKRAWTGRRDARGHKINEDVDATPHVPDCPVLRRDELLGR